MRYIRHLILVVGDQLDLEAAAFDGFDPAQDAVWMAETHEESTHVWSSKQRITLFLSAMRHFAQALRDAGRPLFYHRLDDTGAGADLNSLGAKLQADLATLGPQRVVMTAPGDWRVFQQLKTSVEAAGLKLEVCEDRHFFTTVRDFADHASGRKSLRLEYFYRELRQRYNIRCQPARPLSPTPSRRRLSHWLIPALLATPVRSIALSGQLPAAKPYKHYSALLTNACRFLAAMKTPYGLVSPGCTTRIYPRP